MTARTFRLKLQPVAFCVSFVFLFYAALMAAQGQGKNVKTPSFETPKWNMNALSKVPKTYAAPADLNRAGMRAFFYAGPMWRGRPTKVFAWMGIPAHRLGQRVPGVVLIHGGGGTASDGGVRLWMERGYAAISMDTTGSYPGRNLERHAEGGPRGNGECFAQIEEPVADQWMYQAVSDVILANSLLRAQPDVDAGKIGLTGLSWGGVVAGVVAGVDRRFRWAAPVYGCGFLQGSEYFRPVLNAYHGDKWTALWDPSRYLSRAKMPLLWINGTNDEYFQMDIWQATHRLGAGPRTLSLKIRMNHSGEDGERPDEILVFADSFTRGGRPLPQFGVPKRDGATVTVSIAAQEPLGKAEIVFTRDTGKWSKRHWETEPLPFRTDSRKQTLTALLPTGTTTWYVRVEDARRRNVTTEYEELSSPVPAAAPLPENTVYLAPDGRDTNPGTASQPVATLAHARDIARDLPRDKAVKIVLHGGVYRLTAPLELTKADSGTADLPVVWSAAAGEKVTISGGIPLTGWKTKRVNGKTAWSLVLTNVKSGEWFFRSLYTEQDSRPRARLPKVGFYEVADTEKRTGKDADNWLNGHDRFYYRGNDLSDFADKSSVEAIVLTQWCESHLPLVSVDMTKKFAVFSKFTIQNIGKGQRYWIENTRAALTEPGQWTLNKDTGELLYLPRPGETPQNTHLIAPRAPQLLKLHDTANVAFRNLTFAHSEWWFPADYYAAGWGEHAGKTWAVQQGASAVGGAIQAENPQNVALENCAVAHLGSFGVVFGGAAKNNRIMHTDFFDLGAGGVRIGPENVGRDIKADIAENNLVSDCRIYDAGKLFTGAVGIWVGQARQTRIVHNAIHDMFYTGISCGWQWGFDGPILSRDNTIAWNHIYTLGKNVLGDGAGIYMLGPQPGTVIENNVVHDMNGNYASRGIYLDDGSSEMTVRNNLSYRNKTANFFQWRSRNNRIENNVFALGEESQVELGGAVFNGGGIAMHFERNIIVIAPGPLFNGIHPDAVKSIYKFDRNLFWNTKHNPALPAEARAAGWGANSLETDPLFLDLEKLDFRLKPDSPAITQIGFVPVDWQQAGPRRWFP